MIDTIVRHHFCFEFRFDLVSETERPCFWKAEAKFWTNFCSTTKLSVCGLELSINFRPSDDRLRFWAIVEIKWMKVEKENKMRVNIFIVRVFYFGSWIKLHFKCIETGYVYWYWIFFILRKFHDVIEIIDRDKLKFNFFSNSKNSNSKYYVVSKEWFWKKCLFFHFLRFRRS